MPYTPEDPYLKFRYQFAGQVQTQLAYLLLTLKQMLFRIFTEVNTPRPKDCMLLQTHCIKDMTCAWIPNILMSQWQKVHTSLAEF